MKPLRLKRETKEVRITVILFFAFFLIYAIVNLYPLIWALINSFKTAEEFFASNMSLPTKFRFRHYLQVFKDFNIRNYTYFDMLYNSLWILVLNVGANVASSVLLAYPMAKFRFPGKEFLYSVVIFTQTIPIIGGGAADYKLKLALGMVNNPATIWIGWAVGFDFAFIVFYGAFKGISNTYSEAAYIDGAGDLKVFLHIVLPQAFPCIVAIAITQAISVWNNYSVSMVMLRDYPTLAYGLYIFEMESNYVENSKPIYFAAAVITCIPVVVLYASNLNLIMTNVSAGGLKG